jgi:quinol monooxygenase YgiN
VELAMKGRGVDEVVIEVAELVIQPGRQEEFEAALELGLRTVVAHSAGVRGYTVMHCVEDPERYVMQITWDSVKAHMVDYREGPLSPQFRALCRPFFARPATAQHYEVIVEVD